MARCLKTRRRIIAAVIGDMATKREPDCNTDKAKLLHFWAQQSLSYMSQGSLMSGERERENKETRAGSDAVAAATHCAKRLGCIQEMNAVSLLSLIFKRRRLWQKKATITTIDKSRILEHMYNDINTRE